MALKYRLAALGLVLVTGCAPATSPPTVVLQTDFGTRDGAVAAMRGVIQTIDPRIPIQDLTHEIPPFDIWEAAWRLGDVASYWPEGTIFVSVVDPGVGTERHSAVLKTASGHYFVSPDNGSLTLVAETLGIAAIRMIDEQKNLRPGSERSHTFHGRDLYSYTAARLAAGVIGFDDVGPALDDVVSIEYQQPVIEDDALVGMIPVLDTNFGNVWTNIPESLLIELGVSKNDRTEVVITRRGQSVARVEMPYVWTFGDVAAGEPLLYVNSQGNVSFAINLGSFSHDHGIAAGPDWRVEVRRP